MPALPDPRQEAFCRHYARGPHRGHLGHAYAAAGYSYDRGNASRLSNRPEIEARIIELTAQDEALRRAAMRAAAQRLGLHQARLAREYALIALANPFDSVREDGSLDVTRLAREKGAAVREINVDFMTLPNGSQKIKKLRLVLHDKFKAMDELRRVMGGALDEEMLAKMEDGMAADVPPPAAGDAPMPPPPTGDAAMPPAQDDDTAMQGAQDDDAQTPPMQVDASAPPPPDAGPERADAEGDDAGPAAASAATHARDEEPFAPMLPSAASSRAEAWMRLARTSPEMARRAILDELARTPPGRVWLEAAVPDRP